MSWDNRQGTKKVRGIYQWVDKKYKARILNYGKRLLYDVVVPEPAAFLIDSLKNAVQPESFQLTKPIEPERPSGGAPLSPTDLDPSNYMGYATRYGVTGSVTPSPDEYLQTVTHVDGLDVQKSLTAFGGTISGWYFAAFTISVPPNYKAFSGYIQRTGSRWINSLPPLEISFFVGESHLLRFGPASDFRTANESFTMNNETGDIPVTVNTSDNVIQFNFAIGIHCQRTDKAFEQWQLKTHAVIMAGYQRQLADYQDKLNQYRSAVRSQMALAQNFAHDPSIEQEELKKAFIFLLLGEHFFQAYLPTPDPKPSHPIPLTSRTGEPWWHSSNGHSNGITSCTHTIPTSGDGRPSGEIFILIQDTDPQFEAFLKAGAARVVIPVRPGFRSGAGPLPGDRGHLDGRRDPGHVQRLLRLHHRRDQSQELRAGQGDLHLRVGRQAAHHAGDAETGRNAAEWKPTVVCNPPANE